MSNLLRYRGGGSGVFLASVLFLLTSCGGGLTPASSSNENEMGNGGGGALSSVPEINGYGYHMTLSDELSGEASTCLVMSQGFDSIFGYNPDFNFQGHFVQDADGELFLTGVISFSIEDAGTIAWSCQFESDDFTTSMEGECSTSSETFDDMLPGLIVDFATTLTRQEDSCGPLITWWYRYGLEYAPVGGGCLNWDDEFEQYLFVRYFDASALLATSDNMSYALDKWDRIMTDEDESGVTASRAEDGTITVARRHTRHTNYDKYCSMTTTEAAAVFTCYDAETGGDPVCTISYPASD